MNACPVLGDAPPRLEARAALTVVQAPKERMVPFGRRKPMDMGKVREINQKLERMEAEGLSVVNTGFYFCAECQRITELNPVFMNCVICKSTRVKFHQPIRGMQREIKN